MKIGEQRGQDNPDFMKTVLSFTVIYAIDVNEQQIDSFFSTHWKKGEFQTSQIFPE